MLYISEAVTRDKGDVYVFVTEDKDYMIFKRNGIILGLCQAVRITSAKCNR
jgi:hypothetical protein